MLLSGFAAKCLSETQSGWYIARLPPVASSRWPIEPAEAKASLLPVTIGLLGLDWEASHRSQASNLGWSGPFWLDFQLDSNLLESFLFNFKL